MASEKSHSQWREIHNGWRNSKWLAENVEEVNDIVKDMLKLIEEEGNSFAERAEMYYRRRPELISHVEDFYRMYCALADRHDQVITSNLRKNTRPELKSHGSGSESCIVPEPPSPSTMNSIESTPESKQYLKLDARAVGFDIFLSSGDSSDRSRKGGVDSSFSELESDIDDAVEENQEYISSRLHERLLELEDELQETKKKLKDQDGELHLEHSSNNDDQNELNPRPKILILEEDLSSVNKNLQDSDVEIMNLRKELKESNVLLKSKDIELMEEKRKVLEQDEQISMLRDTILAHKHEIERLKEVAAATAGQFATELSCHTHQIEEFKDELSRTKANYVKEITNLEAECVAHKDVELQLEAEVSKFLQKESSLKIRISELEHVIQDLKTSSLRSNEELLQKNSALELEVLDLSKSNAFLQSKTTLLDAQMIQLQADRARAREECRPHIDELNDNLDALKVAFEMLLEENRDTTARMDSLINDIKHRDERISQMDQQLHQLNLEHARLITKIEQSMKISAELRSRVQELEDEVDKHKVAISDGSEGKREAIRQLCFSLEHYRDGYHQLRQLLQGHKRSAVMAT